MGDVRAIEVKLGTLEDNILGKLGYREYRIFLGTYELNPKPQVMEIPLSSYSSSQLQGFADALGGQGNPISTFKLILSRDIPESILREYTYWRLVRGDFESTCLPISFTVKDSRIIALLGVVKFEGEAPPLNGNAIWNDEKIWGLE